MRVTDSNRGGVGIADGTNLSMRFAFEARKSNCLRMHKACVVPAPLIIGRTSAVDGPGATIGEDLDHTLFWAIDQRRCFAPEAW